MSTVRTKLSELIAKINSDDPETQLISFYISNDLLEYLLTGVTGPNLIIYVNNKFKHICDQIQDINYFRIEFLNDISDEGENIYLTHIVELGDVYIENGYFSHKLFDKLDFIINKCSNIKNFEKICELNNIEHNMLFSYSKHSSTLNVCLLKNELDRKINDESIGKNQIMKYQEKFDDTKLALYKGKTVGEIKDILSELIKKNSYEIGIIPVHLYHYKYIYDHDNYEFKIGDTITHNFFTSTTYNDDLSVMKWLYNKLGKYVRFCILLETGKKYNFISMSTYTSYYNGYYSLWYGDENEIVLDYGTQFRIIDIQEYKFKPYDDIEIYFPISNIYVKIEDNNQMIGGNKITFDDINSILGFIGSADSVVPNLKYEKYKKKYTEIKNMIM